MEKFGHIVGTVVDHESARAVILTHSFPAYNLFKRNRKNLGTL